MTASSAQPASNSAQPASNEERTLILAPFGRDAQLLAEKLGQEGLAVQSCPGFEELCEQIHQGVGLVILAEESLTNETAVQLRSEMERQPEWSKPPLIIMTNQDQGEVGAWRILKLIEGWAFASILERPVRFVTLLSVVRISLQARRRQYQVRDELEARQRAEKAMRKSQAVLRRQLAEIEAIYDSAPIGLCVLDPELRFLRINERMAEINGVPADEHLGHTVREILPALADQIEGIFHRVTTTGEPVRDVELTGITSDQPNRERTWSEYWLPLKDRAGQIVGVNVVAEEITERKHAEQTLTDLNLTLEQRVAERTALARQRAQDLRRLATELGKAEHRERKRLAQLLHDDLQQLLLAIKLRLPVLIEGDGSQLKQHVERIDELVSECVSTSRDLTRELSPAILQHGTLVEIAEWLSRWFGEKHGLNVTVETTSEIPATTEGYRVFFFQAVRELLTNAIKYSGSMKARLVLSVQQESLDVQVADGGSNFDPQTVKKEGGASEGFGLFNVKERLEALGGQLEIQKTCEGGACFRLLVPLGEVTESAEEEANPRGVEMIRSRVKSVPAQSNRIRILIADDHAVVREGFVSLLNRQLDFEVVGEAADGEEVLEKSETLQPDVVVMDVNMPKLSGIEATRRIRERQAGIAVVGLSLHEDEGIARAVIEAGAAAYVNKHAPTKEVVDAIRRACGQDVPAESPIETLS